MSHYFDSGFTVREPAWHGLGYVADRHPENWDEAREWAGLKWEPISEPVYALAGVDDEGRERYEPITEFKRVARSDTGATLGIPSKIYTIISHSEMGHVVDAILEQPNVKYETAGATHGGRQVWALAYLDEPVTLPGDNSVTLPYLALTTRHDGTGALKALSTSVKIVCANTFSAAEAEGDRNGVAFTFSHSGKPMERVAEARETIKGLRQDFQAYAELAEQLLKVRVSAEQTETFIRVFIPAPPDGLITKRVLGNVEKARETVRGILASPTSEGIAGSGWGLVQAAGEYLDHYRKARTLDSYYTRQLLRPEPLKAKAVQLVRELTNA